MNFSIEITRPDDLLRLRIDARNLKVDRDDSGTDLIVDDAAQPAFLIVNFPPQAIAEGAYFEASIVPGDLPPGVDPGPPVATETPAAPGSVPVRIARGSRLVFKVPVGRAVFAARVAFDDTALQLPVRGSVDVTVRVGDAVVFQQKDLRAGAPPAPIGPVPVRAGDQVSLEVDFGGGRDLGDRVDWLLPVFLPAATAAK